jgi:hypothetical protein
MAGLRTLLEYGSGGDVPTNGTMTVTRILASSPSAVNNGGSCCLWTVPANVTWIGVEAWGGGGAGAGAPNCHAGRSGGPGAYGRKIFSVTPGDAWTICAGGTTCCLSSCCGCTGFGSYICKASTCCMCVSGGSGGCTLSYGNCNCGNSLNNCQTGCILGSTLCIRPVQGHGKWTYGGKCNFKQFAPGAPYAHTTGIWSMTGCATCHGLAFMGNCVPYPGHGGMSGNSSGGQVCGAPGGSGMVQLLYVASE